MMLLALYNSEVAAANRRSRGLDRVLAKPLAAQVRCRFRAGPEASDDLRSAIALGIERRERRGGHRWLNSVALELVPDALVAESPLGEGDGSGKGVAVVVEVAEPFERLEGLGTPILAYAGAFQPLLELTAGAVMVLERPGGDLAWLGVSRHGRSLQFGLIGCRLGFRLDVDLVGHRGHLGRLARDGQETR